MLILYRVGIACYSLLVKIAALFNSKAEKFTSGRKDLFKRLEVVKGTKEPIVWVHAASLGEFEQGRPVIEGLKKDRPEVKILLTFYSPSGYEIRKNYELADWVFYLPLDTPGKARRFVETVNPAVAIFVKYEFWYYFLKTLRDRKVPTLMISAIFRSNQVFFKSSGRFFEPVLKGITHYFVQDQSSLKLISRITGEENVSIAGDTRFDRVIDIAAKAKDFEVVKEFAEGARVMVLGSTWPTDMKEITSVLNTFQDQLKYIIAPHNIKEDEIKELEASFPGAVRYSDPQNLKTAKVLIIDNIGMLSSLYRYGDFAFIGGGFRGALHNTLEAAIYGIPVFFGKHENNAKFAEAIALEKEGAAWAFESGEAFESTLKELLENDAFYTQTAKKAESFVKDGSGATQKILKKVLELI